MSDETNFRGTVGLADLHNLRGFIDKSLKQFKVDDEIRANTVLVADEWITNVITHGYQGSGGKLEIDITHKDDFLRICFMDQGTEFDLTQVKLIDPDLDTFLKRSPGGLGIALISRLVTKIDYNRSDQGLNKTCFKIALN